MHHRLSFDSLLLVFPALIIFYEYRDQGDYDDDNHYDTEIVLDEWEVTEVIS